MNSRNALIASAELIATVFGGCVVLAPWAIAVLGPFEMWQRGLALIGLAGFCGVIWMKVPWPSGWGGVRDYFAFTTMLSAVVAIVCLLIAAARALAA